MLVWYDGVDVGALGHPALTCSIQLCERIASPMNLPSCAIVLVLDSYHQTTNQLARSAELESRIFRYTTISALRQR
jgi:hypothetical protein